MSQRHVMKLPIRKFEINNIPPYDKHKYLDPNLEKSHELEQRFVNYKF